MTKKKPYHNHWRKFVFDIQHFFYRLFESDPLEAETARARNNPPRQRAWIYYNNWRGEHGGRDITPIRIYFGSTEYHQVPQWLLLAYDHDKNDLRVFAMNGITRWDMPQ